MVSQWEEEEVGLAGYVEGVIPVVKSLTDSDSRVLRCLIECRSVSFSGYGWWEAARVYMLLIPSAMARKTGLCGSTGDGTQNSQKQLEDQVSTDDVEACMHDDPTGADHVRGA